MRFAESPIEQVYYPYWKWEDWKAGLYKQMNTDIGAVEKCADLLSNPESFFSSASEMICAWPIAASVNLSNVSQNRQAWIGQATCCFLFGAPEWITKLAWRSLSEDTQRIANEIADQAIAAWEVAWVRGDQMEMFCA